MTISATTKVADIKTSIDFKTFFELITKDVPFAYADHAWASDFQGDKPLLEWLDDFQEWLTSDKINELLIKKENT